MPCRIRVAASLSLLALLCLCPRAQAQSFSPIANSFSGPTAIAIDKAGNIFVADTDNNAVKEIVAAGGYGTVKTLATGLYRPSGIAVDAQGDVFVADTYNWAIKELPAASGYATIRTLSTAFELPQGLAVDASGNLFVADTGHAAVKEIPASGNYSTVRTIGSGFSSPIALAVDAGGNVFVSDAGHRDIEEIQAAGGYSTVKPVISDPIPPVSLAFDPAGNLYAVDYGLREILAAGNYTTAYPPSLLISSVALDKAGNLYGIRGASVGRVLSPPYTPIAASVLPGAQAFIHPVVTMFAAMANGGSAAVNNCSIGLPSDSDLAGYAMNYQTTDPATNQLTGTPNTPVTIPGGGVQTFLLAFTATNALYGQVSFFPQFTCSGVAPAAAITGIDSISLDHEQGTSGNVVALVATASNDGVIRVPKGGAAAFAVATIGQSVDTVFEASVNTGGAILPITVTICETNPQTSLCLAPPAPSAQWDTRSPSPPTGTFSVFVQSSGTIAFAPAQARIFVTFSPQNSGLSYTSTSVAVQSP